MADEFQKYSIPQLLEMMKANHLTHMKVGGIELTMSETEWTPKPPIQTLEELKKVMADAGDGLTPDEQLFYSVEGIWKDPEVKN